MKSSWGIIAVSIPQILIALYISGTLAPELFRDNPIAVKEWIGLPIVVAMLVSWGGVLWVLLSKDAKNALVRLFISIGFTLASGILVFFAYFTAL